MGRTAGPWFSVRRRRERLPDFAKVGPGGTLARKDRVDELLGAN